MKQMHRRTLFAVPTPFNYRSLARAVSLSAFAGTVLLTAAHPVRAQETTASLDSLYAPLRGVEAAPSAALTTKVPDSILPDAETETTSDTPTRLKKYAPTFDVESVLTRYNMTKRGQTCQLGIVPSPVPIGIRLGAALSPRLRFDGGVDVTIPGLSFAHNLSSRVDFDAIIAANFGGISTLFPLTFDQVYRFALPVGSSIYVGGGIGPYFGERTRFGGKLLIGGTITTHFGLEGALHFSGYGDPITTVQARFPF